VWSKSEDELNLKNNWGTFLIGTWNTKTFYGLVEMTNDMKYVCMKIYANESVLVQNIR
jgi:3-phenylpropionate/cinnamic acid dioxygenase small subunit